LKQFRRVLVTASVVGFLVTLPFSTTAFADDAVPVRANVSAPAGRSTIDPDNLLVRFKTDAADQTKIDSLIKQHKLVEQSDMGSDDLDMYKVDTDESPKTVASDLIKAGVVELAEPDYDIKASSISNDPDIDSYWGLSNSGQNIGGQTGTAGVDINAPAAWSSATGNGVIVAVLDEGIDISHPELASHIWTNSADCHSDGIDHDNDGYVNDCHGWDFYHNDNQVFSASDGDDHGTHVAGTIAAALNNGVGGAGVAPNVTIMPLKFLGPNGGSTSDAITAINYAKAHGAKIVNCSWGGTAFSQALEDAIANSGMMFAVAAGNSGANIASSPEYPASFNLPNIVTVAAVDNRGTLASFSDYGGTTAVGAPGVNIFSTIPKRQAATIGMEDNGSNFKSAWWGFGLEAVVGRSTRAALLQAELNHLGATTSSQIMLVDDDESSSGSSLTPDTASYYSTALSDDGYTNVTPVQVTKDSSGPSTSTMSGKYVIWETGYADGSQNVDTLTSSDLSNLQSFLTSGGRLLMAGADSIWRNETSNFVENYLGISFQSEGDTRTAASGVNNTTYAGLSLDLSGTDSPKGTLNPYQDVAKTYTTQAQAVVQLNADTDYAQAYGYKSGTSMATPHVSGVAALAAEANPNASAVQLATYVKNGVTPLSSLSNGVTTTGGIVNAAKTVALAEADAHPATDGYRFVASDGGIFSFGNAPFEGSTGGQHLNQPVVGMAGTPSRNGYWLVARDGGIFGFGDAAFEGSAGGIKLNQPIVGMASTPDGNGYWLVAQDGGIFAYGDAKFFGSTGGTKLNQPIVGMASTPDGNGYWLVASDGGIFAYGDASFFGSTGGTHLNQPIVGMTTTPNGAGYWLVARDGGIFGYGSAAFYGSTGGTHLNQPIVGMAHSPTGNGYWLVASDGGIFAYGDAGFFGSTGAIKLNQPIVAMSH
jgi:subtilisin family serine protease